MEIVKWAILSIMSSFHGLAVGFGFSSRKVVVVWYHILALILFTFMVSVTSSFMGHLFRDLISVGFVRFMMGLAIIGIGAGLIINKPVYPGYKDFFLLSTALQLDIFYLSFYYRQTHEGGTGLALTLSFILLGSIVLGMMLGQSQWRDWRIRILLPYVPGALLILLGIIKMI